MFNESFEEYGIDFKHCLDVDINMVKIPSLQNLAQENTSSSTEQTNTIPFYFSSSENITVTESLKPKFCSSNNSKSESFIFKLQESSYSKKDETIQQNDILNSSEFTFNKKSVISNLNSNYNTFLNSKFSDFDNNSNPFIFNEVPKEFSQKNIGFEKSSNRSLNNSEVINSIVFDSKNGIHTKLEKITPSKVKDMFEANLKMIKKSENEIIYEDSREDTESVKFHWVPYNNSFSKTISSHENYTPRKNKIHEKDSPNFKKKHNVPYSSSHRRACSLNYKEENICINININTRSEETTIIKDPDELSLGKDSTELNFHKEYSFQSSTELNTRKGQYDDSVKASQNYLKSKASTNLNNSNEVGCSFFGLNYIKKQLMPCIPFKK